MVKHLQDDAALTKIGHAVGTLVYMPLEQAMDSRTIDGRCDIYALGCVFYACLTGKPPFRGRNMLQMMEKKQRGTFRPASKYNRKVSARVDEIIARMTARQIESRYQDCRAIIRDLEKLGGVRPASAAVP
jgi:serine/threonine-protein kinase